MDSGSAGERPPRSAAQAPGSWRQAAVVAAAVVCVALVGIGISLGPAPHARGQRIALGIMAFGLALLLSRWPLLLVVAAAAGTVAETAAGFSSFPVCVLLAAAIYFAASRLPRRWTIPVALAVAAAIGAALIYAAAARLNPPVVSDAVEGLVPLAAGWFIGDSTAARRRYLVGLAEQAARERDAEAERAQQDVRAERVRIARELHDLVAHTLVVMTVQAGVGRRLMERQPEEAARALQSIETIGRTAQDELHVVLGLLRDEGVEAASLAPAPNLTDLKELVETVRASGTPVELRMTGLGPPLLPALELSVYRVVQEALTNVVKHAPGATTMVEVAQSDCEIRVEVTDDAPLPGRGPRSSQGRPTEAGHGIVGMRERVAAFGGRLVAEPMEGQGFRVVASIPIEGAA